MGYGSLVVSIPKAGTHLVVSLLKRFGYIQLGGPSKDDQLTVAAKVLLNEPFKSLMHECWYLTPDKMMLCIAAEALSRLVALGPDGWVPNLRDEMPILAQKLKLIRSDQLFGADCMLAIHNISFNDRCGRFLNEWANSGQPRLIFNYRDPRDQLLSLIHFLRDSPLAGPVGRWFGPILRSRDTLKRQIAYAIDCQSFPFRGIYRANAWMLHHPAVLKIRFEDLVGEEGGGDPRMQIKTIDSLAGFLNVTVDSQVVRKSLFGGTDTFRLGQMGGWRKEFSPTQVRSFERQFGDVLSEYGYG
jgi:hypothetical protein